MENVIEKLLGVCYRRVQGGLFSRGYLQYCYRAFQRRLLLRGLVETVKDGFKPPIIEEFSEDFNRGV